MTYSFSTTNFSVHINGLADYLGIDGMAGPDYKVSRSKIIGWQMEVVPGQSMLKDIIFTCDKVKFDFSWSVVEEYLDEAEAMRLKSKHAITSFKGEINGWMAVDASKETGWSIEFADFDLRGSMGFEKEIDEVEVNIDEKTILIR